jgi:energy-coupling factor transporter ATP-binding protein EcfA2
VVDKYVPYLNERINYFLNELGFNVAIILDKNFSEKFLSLSREGFSYSNLSDGQRARIDISILFSFLELSSKKNSVDTNLLLLDEILEPLDTSGVESCIKLFNNEMYKNKNIFVITQRFEEMRDKFRSELIFKLKNNFTELV